MRRWSETAFFGGILLMVWHGMAVDGGWMLMLSHGQGRGHGYGRGRVYGGMVKGSGVDCRGEERRVCVRDAGSFTSRRIATCRYTPHVSWL